jgi:hypothetical protein
MSVIEHEDACRRDPAAAAKYIVSVEAERDGAVATLTSVRVWAEITRDRSSDEHVRRHMRMLLTMLDNAAGAAHSADTQAPGSEA